MVITAGLTSRAQPFPKGSDYKVGMVFGINYGSIIGSELQNPSPMLGMNLGAHFRHKFGKTFHLSSELNATFRGSNFNNGETDAYSQVKFVYLDLPLNLMVNVDGNDQSQFVTLGLEPAYLMESEIYVKPNDIKATYKNFGFRQFDLAAVIGYHFDFYYFGIRPSIRIGLININDNLFMPNVFPETGTQGTIKNATFDLKIYF